LGRFYGRFWSRLRVWNGPQLDLRHSRQRAGKVKRNHSRGGVSRPPLFLTDAGEVVFTCRPREQMREAFAIIDRGLEIIGYKALVD
jgi:hypothetical protein